MNLAQSNTSDREFFKNSQKPLLPAFPVTRMEKCKIIGLLSLPADPELARSTGAAAAPGARRFSAV